MKHTLKKMKDGYTYLHRDGQPLICPHQLPQQEIKQGLGGQEVIIKKQGCGSYCALFSIDKDMIKPLVQVSLECSFAVYQATEIEE